MSNQIQNPNVKKIAMIIAFQDFRDEEYVIPKSIFQQQGFEVKTISHKKGQAIGSYGGSTNVDLTLDELKTDEFEAIVFVGGGGAVKYFNDEICWQIAKEAVEKNKVLAAICIAPVILAKSGVLQNKKATVWQSNLDKSAVKFLKQGQADFQAQDVVVDEKIITANGPRAARKFAETVIRVLTG